MTNMNLEIQKIILQYYKKKQHLKMLNLSKIKSFKFKNNLKMKLYQLKKVLIKLNNFHKLSKIYNQKKKSKRHLKFYNKRKSKYEQNYFKQRK